MSSWSRCSSTVPAVRACEQPRHGTAARYATGTTTLDAAIGLDPAVCPGDVVAALLYRLPRSRLRQVRLIVSTDHFVLAPGPHPPSPHQRLPAQGSRPPADSARVLCFC